MKKKTVPGGEHQPRGKNIQEGTNVRTGKEQHQHDASPVAKSGSPGTVQIVEKTEKKPQKKDAGTAQII